MPSGWYIICKKAKSNVFIKIISVGNVKAFSRSGNRKLRKQNSCKNERGIKRSTMRGLLHHLSMGGVW